MPDTVALPFPKMIVFDVAGTTVRDGDDAVARAVCDALRADGVDLPLADVDPVMGMPKPLAIATLLQRSDSSPAEPDPARVARIYRDFEARMVEHYAHAPHVAPKPDAEATFDWVHEHGGRVGLDTGFARPILDTILERFGWLDRGLVDDTVTSDEVQDGRPNPEMIHVLMRRAVIDDPQHVWKVGDSESDLEQGVRAGCGLVAAVLNARTRVALKENRYAGVRPIQTLTDLRAYAQVASASPTGVAAG